MTDHTEEPGDEPQSDDADEPGDEPGPLNVQPGGTELKLTGSQVGYTIRDYMAVHHLWAAQRWARMCDEAESKLVADGNNEMDFGHRSLAVAAIMSSVAFLEAFINEFYADAASPGAVTYRTEGLSAAVLAQVAQSWADGETPGQPDKVPKVLRLYRHALHCAQAPGFDTGGDPYQSAVLLIQLRNTLVHFVPETHAHDSVHKLETGLRKRFDENRQAIGGVPWYSTRALGSGCARWAYKAAMALVDDWQRRMCLAHDYHEHLDGMDQRP